MALNLNTPIFHEFDIDKNNEIIKQCIKNYLVNKYSQYHELVFDFYNYCKNNKPKGKDSITYISQVFEDTENTKYKNIPKYVKDYFSHIKNEIAVNKKTKTLTIDEILLKVDDKDTFLNELNILLENAIDEYLELNIENDENSDENDY